MRIQSIHTPLLHPGDDLAEILRASEHLEAHDILVISSKAIATVERAAIDLRTLQVSNEARTYAEACGKSPAFCQAVIEETKRLHGRILGSAPHALLTSVLPDGTNGELLVPNAGLDQSNIEDGFAIGWPHDPIASSLSLRKVFGNTAPAIIISDSCLRPGRLGVIAFALTCDGLDPIVSQVGKPDLFGHPLRVTQEAIADQLAVAANAVMGNAAQSTPAAVIREHGLPQSTFRGWVAGIRREEDLFGGFYR